MHNGKIKKTLENIQRRDFDNSCQVEYPSGQIKTIWLNNENGRLSIKISDSKSILQNCLGVIIIYFDLFLIFLDLQNRKIKSTVQSRSSDSERVYKQ